MATRAMDDECCGRHAVCERDSLLVREPEVEYYDDEELDRLADMDPADYTAEDLAELREVFDTLLPQDVAGWCRSVQQRRIELPESIREEAILIVADRREQHAKH